MATNSSRRAAFQRSAEGKASDAAEAIDGNFRGHGLSCSGSVRRRGDRDRPPVCRCLRAAITSPPIMIGSAITQVCTKSFKRAENETEQPAAFVGALCFESWHKVWNNDTMVSRPSRADRHRSRRQRKTSMRRNRNAKS